MINDKAIDNDLIDQVINCFDLVMKLELAIMELQALELGYGEGIDGMIKPCFDGYDGSPLFKFSNFKLPY